MTESFVDLRELPRSERLEALEEIVVREFRDTLLMTDDEEFPLSESFFDLGFTSLRITEAKQRLEARLDCSISSNVLFNHPTAQQLVEYLMSDVLTGLFSGSADRDV